MRGPATYTIPFHSTGDPATSGAPKERCHTRRRFETVSGVSRVSSGLSPVPAEVRPNCPQLTTRASALAAVTTKQTKPATAHNPRLMPGLSAAGENLSSNLERDGLCALTELELDIGRPPMNVVRPC
jgi:hypothetical protein